MYDIQHCFICHPSDSIVSEDPGNEPRTVATTALAGRRSNHSATTARYIIPPKARPIPLKWESFADEIFNFKQSSRYGTTSYALNI